MKQLLFILALLLTVQTSSAAVSPCVQEANTVWLDTLQVHTCLVRSTEVTGGDAGMPPVVSHVRQTIKNVGNQPIELELSSDLIFRLAPTIFRDGVAVNKLFAFPTPHDPTPLPGDESYRLNPGQERAFSYRVADLMTEPPRDQTLYEFAVMVTHGYRYLNEAAGNSVLRRNREANAKKHYLSNPIFKGVRLK